MRERRREQRDGDIEHDEEQQRASARHCAERPAQRGAMPALHFAGALGTTSAATAGYSSPDSASHFLHDAKRSGIAGRSGGFGEDAQVGGLALHLPVVERKRERLPRIAGERQLEARVLALMRRIATLPACVESRAQRIDRSCGPRGG
jgi:hypothetical protein